MGQGRKRFQADVEALEGRDLLSSLRAVGPTPDRARAHGPYLNLIVVGPENTRSARVEGAHVRAARAAERTPSWFDPSLTQQLVKELYAPVVTMAPIKVNNTVFPAGTYPVPQPSEREVKRETFWAEFKGRYSVGAPRFSNQAATVHIYSDRRSVASNLFRSGRGQVLLFPPADPSAQPSTTDPVAGQTVGLVTLFASNVLQSGSSIYFNAINLPGVPSNDPAALDHGLPSRLRLILDPAGVTSGLGANPVSVTTPPVMTDPTTGAAVPLLGSSGGAVAYTEGLGILEIKYNPDNRLKAGATESGSVEVRIQGVIKPSGGTTNPLYKGIN
jgi:hypothetical protein